jgi:hypothetical protein
VRAFKRVVRRILDVVGRQVAFAQVRWTCRRAHGGRIVALDVDNTLADTWPTLTTSWPNERTRLGAIPTLPNIKAVAHDEAVARGDVPLFISRRAWWHWGQTYRWLRRHGFAATPSNVVLVASPRDKLALLRRCLRAGPVTYWDDLSHSHEAGKVQLFEDVTSEVNALPIEYKGWDAIREVVEGTPPR